MFHAPRRRNKSKFGKQGIFLNQQPVVVENGPGNKKNEKLAQPLRARNIQKQGNQPDQKKLGVKAKEEEKENMASTDQETKATEQQYFSDADASALQQLPVNMELQAIKEEIKSYVTVREEHSMIDHGYLRKHKILTFKMRSYLVRHIFKIYRKMGLKRTTLHLAVQYMDMYFSRCSHIKDQLETVYIAQASLFIAMKYEEIYPPELADWVAGIHHKEIIRLEAEILHLLDFSLIHYTLQHFLYYSLWQSNQRRQRQPVQLAFLLMDLSLFDLNMRQFRPSQLAVCLYRMSLNPSEDYPLKEMAQNVKWMFDRNRQTLTWLVQNGYQSIAKHIFD